MRIARNVFNTASPLVLLGHVLGWLGNMVALLLAIAAVLVAFTPGVPWAAAGYTGVAALTSFAAGRALRFIFADSVW